MSPPPGLLVSVRSAADAAAALAGGADLIDVKEPERGPLGAADDDVIAAVVAEVRGRVPVSTALGEWAESGRRSVPPGVAYAKWGLAGCGAAVATVVRAVRRHPVGARPVLVAYADWRRAGSPDPELLADMACELEFPAFLIDTAVKDGSRLPDWIEPGRLRRIRDRLAAARVPLALAGSLDGPAIEGLAPVVPAWFAVRGAACVGGRAGVVSPDRVSALRQTIRLAGVSRRAG